MRQPIRLGAAILAGILTLTVSTLQVQPASAARATVNKVAVKEYPGKVQVGLTASGPVRYRVTDWAGKPDTMIIVDIIGAELGVPSGDVPHQVREGLDRVRIGQANDATVRLVVETTTRRSYAVTSVDGGRTVTLAVDTASPLDAKAPAAPTAQKPETPKLEVAKADASRTEMTKSETVPSARTTVATPATKPAPAAKPAPAKATEPAAKPAPMKATEPAAKPAPAKATEPAAKPAPAKAKEPAAKPAPVKVTSSSNLEARKPDSSLPAAPMAQTQRPVAPPPPPPAAPTPAATAQPTRTAAGRINLEFRDAKFSDVISAVAMLVNLNIVVAPEAADRRVTIRLMDVSLEEALNLLTQPLGLGWTRTGRNIVILPEAKLPGDPFEIRYYQVAHASAEDVAKAIEPLLFGRRLTAPAAPAAPASPASPAPGATPAPAAPGADGGGVVGTLERSQISVDKRTNTLIIIASRADHQRAADIIQRLDVPVPVARLSTRVYPMQWLNADLKAAEGGPAKDVGGEMVALMKAHLGPQAVVTFDYTSNALIITALDGDHDRARGLLAQVDVPLPQIMIETTVLDVNRDLINSLGIEWTFATGDTPSVTFQLPTAPAGSISFGTVTRQAASFSATLRAIVTDGRGRLLANPRVVTKDGQVAQIFIGDQVPVVTGTTSTGIPIVTFIDAGVKLNITPKINPDGIVTTRILTEVGAVRNFATGVGRATRTAFTTLSVKDGTSIVIGGLIRNEERFETQKVPFLGDIPIIGFLFRRESTTRNNSEVVLVLTPRILARAPGS